MVLGTLYTCYLSPEIFSGKQERCYGYLGSVPWLDRAKLLSVSRRVSRDGWRRARLNGNILAFTSSRWGLWCALIKTQHVSCVATAPRIEMRRKGR